VPPFMWNQLPIDVQLHQSVTTLKRHSKKLLFFTPVS